MGFAKEMMLRHQEQLAVATKVAVQAGVLGRCEFHGNVYDRLGGDYTPAYKLGNYLFSNGELAGMFRNRQELTDSIKAAIEDSAMECYDCAKWTDD